ncbi:hypothetical protein FQN49_000204 [Arthroderma sp. PD_2]|nr:hypothetical protein FQN49_000204 [Arthroderma sp. PD_2]
MTAANLPKHRIYTARSRPDLWDELKDDSHPLNVAWPLFLDQDACFQTYYRQLAKCCGLSAFQYAMVEENYGQETIIACGRSIPFYWPELDQFGGRTGLEDHPEVWDTLPDTGYDAILTRGINQYFSRQGLEPASLEANIDPRTLEYIDDVCYRTEQPNALSAISITVHPDYRSMGIAEAIIGAMKEAARDNNLETLVVPLRPTRKQDHPFTSMEDYITWPQLLPKANFDLPFDPWLRKHVRLGGKFVKIAQQSMYVEGSIAAWQKWTRCDQWKTCLGAVKFEEGPRKSRLYIEVAFPGGLAPLRLYILENIGVYIEPNVWLYHDL